MKYCPHCGAFLITNEYHFGDRFCPTAGCEYLYSPLAGLIVINPDHPFKILCQVWDYLAEDRLQLPKIMLMRRRSTGAYNRKEHTIFIRKDSWEKMCLAEKRLLVIHEATHAKGIPHTQGFRTSADALSPIIYKHIWGEDTAWIEFQAMLEKTLAKLCKKSCRK